MVTSNKLTKCYNVYWRISVLVVCITILSRLQKYRGMLLPMCWYTVLNTLRPRQNGHDFADDIFKWVFLNENVWIAIKISLNFVPKGQINNIPALVQIMDWRRPMMDKLPTHICATRPHWVKSAFNKHVWSVVIVCVNHYYRVTSVLLKASQSTRNWHVFNSLISLRAKITSKLSALVALCEGNHPKTGDFPLRRVNNAE